MYEPSPSYQIQNHPPREECEGKRVSKMRSNSNSNTRDLERTYPTQKPPHTLLPEGKGAEKSNQ
ncbi:hypothetical protein F7725_001296 [Dissostichus mawsoni]|uniref:Uncharacterized protein n=1 Tax=Dissostichus mawsoni TaxID=36200 RepID=A0A7J5ZIX7_DISMA|nr:hypothetical protein F7725_001296 [Dissostichus mawsoni]